MAAKGEWCERYEALTGETALRILETVESLGWEPKEELENVALDYMAYNLSEMIEGEQYWELMRENRDLHKRVLKHVHSILIESMVPLKFESDI